MIRPDLVEVLQRRGYRSISPHLWYDGAVTVSIHPGGVHVSVPNGPAYHDAQIDGATFLGELIAAENLAAACPLPNIEVLTGANPLQYAGDEDFQGEWVELAVLVDEDRDHHRFQLDGPAETWQLELADRPDELRDWLVCAGVSPRLADNYVDHLQRPVAAAYAEEHAA